MKTINVVAAIIVANENGDKKIFAAQRGYGEFINMYEMPGGKVEAGESREEALIREISEELETEIKVERFVQTIEYDYETFHLSMDCYECSIVKGHLHLLEHKDAKWLTKETLHSVHWLPADELLLGKLEEILK